MIRGLSVLVVAATCLQGATAFASDSTGASASPAPAEVKKLPGGAVIRIAPGSRVKFEKPIRLQLAPSGNPKTLTYSVHLTSGRIEIDLPEGKNPVTAVLIACANKVSAVAKGGHSVVIAAPRRVTVGAITGEMLAAAGNQWKPVASGIVREFGAGSVLGDHAVMSAPTVALSAPISFHIAGAENQATTSATTSTIPHARSYDFGLWKNERGERVLLRRIPSNETAIQLPSLEAGSYSVSARAIESSGLESPDSEPVPLRVVGASLPPGAKLVEGSVLLGQFQRVSLAGVEGVEVSYGRAPQFIAAPSTIGLIRGQSTLVRLRAAGSTGELSLALEPRLVHADIQIGPRRARWPQDAISVAVRLTDAHGRPFTATKEVKPTVHVNVTEVPLEWKHKDNVMTTMVPRPSEPGPWVVRVEIVDDTGAIVGRDFLEVATEENRHARR